MKYWNSRVSISKQHAYTEPSIIDTEATYIYNFVVATFDIIYGVQMCHIRSFQLI